MLYHRHWRIEKIINLPNSWFDLTTKSSFEVKLGLGIKRKKYVRQKKETEDYRKV